MVCRETAAQLNSISKPRENPVPGESEAKRLPSSITTALRTRMTRSGAACPTMPARSMRATKGAALPSMIGTSGPVMSITALSMAQPRRAAIRCSTVLTVAPSSLPTVVDIRVSTTRSQVAGITEPPAMSVRRNTIPLPASPGRSVIDTMSPQCRAMPVHSTGPLRVFWRMIFLRLNFAAGLRLPRETPIFPRLNSLVRFDPPPATAQSPWAHSGGRVPRRCLYQHRPRHSNQHLLRIVTPTQSLTVNSPGGAGRPGYRAGPPRPGRRPRARRNRVRQAGRGRRLGAFAPPRRRPPRRPWRFWRHGRYR